MPKRSTEINVKKNKKRVKKRNKKIVSVVGAESSIKSCLTLDIVKDMCCSALENVSRANHLENR